MKLAGNNLSSIKKRSAIFNPWQAGSGLIALLVLLPLVFVARSLFFESSSAWQILLKNGLIYDYLIATGVMVVGVSILSSTIGVLLAWFVTMYQFPGKTFFTVALIFPLAIPSYISAYTYSFLTDNASLLLNAIDDLYWARKLEFIHTYLVAIFVLSLCLYPYIYVATRVAFADISTNYLENSRLLGHGLWSSFRHLVLPLARPAILGGVILVNMEVINDYGTMQYFGIPTLTSGIFLMWSNFGDLNAAVKLSAITLLVVLGLILIERKCRGKACFHNHRSHRHSPGTQVTTPISCFLALLFCSLLLTLAFIIPVSRLLLWASYSWKKFDWSYFAKLVFNSLSVAFVSSLIILIISLFLNYAVRVYPSFLSKSSLKVSLLGYCLPGAVITVSILVTSTSLDNWLMQSNFWPNLILTGTFSSLIMAYVLRYLAISIQPIEAGFKRIHTHLDEASSLLGASKLKSFFLIHLPLLKYSILGSVILLTIDILKELPITLNLSPFNFETLATATYGLAQGEERIAESAIPALLLIFIASCAIIYLRHLILKTSR